MGWFDCHGQTPHWQSFVYHRSSSKICCCVAIVDPHHISTTTELAQPWPGTELGTSLGKPAVPNHRAKSNESTDVLPRVEWSQGLSCNDCRTRLPCNWLTGSTGLSYTRPSTLANGSVLPSSGRPCYIYRGCQVNRRWPMKEVTGSRCWVAHNTTR